MDDQLGPGLYLIKAFSNLSPFVTAESAAKTFDYRAKQLCPSGFTEIRYVVAAYNSSIQPVSVPIKGSQNLDLPGYVTTAKIGHVLCNGSPITPYEAKALVAPESE